MVREISLAACRQCSLTRYNRAGFIERGEVRDDLDHAALTLALKRRAEQDSESERPPQRRRFSGGPSGSASPTPPLRNDLSRGAPDSSPPHVAGVLTRETSLSASSTNNPRDGSPSITSPLPSVLERYRRLPPSSPTKPNGKPVVWWRLHYKILPFHVRSKLRVAICLC
jgi:hypothetical protein